MLQWKWLSVLSVVGHNSCPSTMPVCSQVGFPGWPVTAPWPISAACWQAVLPIVSRQTAFIASSLAHNWWSDCCMPFGCQRVLLCRTVGSCCPLFGYVIFFFRLEHTMDSVDVCWTVYNSLLIAACFFTIENYRTVWRVKSSVFVGDCEQPSVHDWEMRDFCIGFINIASLPWLILIDSLVMHAGALFSASGRILVLTSRVSRLILVAQ